MAMSLATCSRENELKEFDATKSGVKGIADSGITKLPRIFVHEQITPLDQKVSNNNPISTVPVIDLQAADHSIMLDQVRDASEKWGFFQVVNHGIPSKTLDDMIQGIRLFHEQDVEIKKALYSRDSRKSVVYHSNIDLYYSKAAVWKDSITCKMLPCPPDPQELPAVCRDVTIEYSRCMMDLVLRLFNLLSEVLGLEKSHLVNIGCSEGLLIKGHYYPPCPQPELTLGTSIHTDNDFLTVLLQDDRGGLQVLHKNEWVDVPPLPGALIVNLGDLLQLITNDRFKSVHHRVLAKKTGPRISVACFLRPNQGEGYTSRLYGPIPELLSEKNTPIYKGVTVEAYTKYFISKSLNGDATLSHFKLAK